MSEPKPRLSLRPLLRVVEGVRVWGAGVDVDVDVDVDVGVDVDVNVATGAISNNK